MNHHSEFTYTVSGKATSRHGTVRSVNFDNGTLRGLSYLKHSNGTVRGLSSLPHEMKVVPVPQELHFKETSRGTHRAEKAISNFKILFDNGQKYQPGMDIKGKVVMDVWSPIEIRYVEFILQGKGVSRAFKNGGNFSSKPKTEVYLDKKILLLSPQGGDTSMSLAPGKYVSTFLYKLPTNIPSTVLQTEVGDGHVFSITYSAQANVCDFIRNTQNPQQQEKYAQVVKSTKCSFTVVPDVDYQSLPGALDPISHAEQLNMMLTCFGFEPTSVMVKLDHQVYTLGDIMGLHLEIFINDHNRIGEIRADFEQKMRIKGSESPPTFKRILVRALDNPRERKYRLASKRKHITKKINKNLYKTGFKIPIPGNLMPSLLPHTKLVEVNYFINVKVDFTRLGGSLNLRIPVTVTSPMDPDVVELQQSNIPVFNKPVMQFPYFAQNQLRGSRKSLNSTVTSVSDESIVKKIHSQDRKSKRKHEKVHVSHKNFFGF